MPYKVAIRKNNTDEIRFYEIKWDWYKNRESGDLFWWTEGNYSCDCNRELCWLRAGGDDPDLYNVKCSDGRFSALYAELPDGEKIQLDEAEVED